MTATACRFGCILVLITPTGGSQNPPFSRVEIETRMTVHTLSLVRTAHAGQNPPFSRVGGLDKSMTGSDPRQKSGTSEMTCYADRMVLSDAAQSVQID